jgi:hypothetical protein
MLHQGLPLLNHPFALGGCLGQHREILDQGSVIALCAALDPTRQGVQ